MLKPQSFQKGAAVLLLSAAIAKLLGACFKIPLTNVLGGTGMGYFSSAYGLLLPVYALSVTGLSAAVSQAVSHAAALSRYREIRRIHTAARLVCGILGLVLALGMLVLAKPFAIHIAAQPDAQLSVAAIAPAALFGCLTAVERGYWEGLQHMTPTAVSQAIEAAVKTVLGLLLCQWVLQHPEQICPYFPADLPLAALAAAAAVAGVTGSTIIGYLYFLLRNLCTRRLLPAGTDQPAPMRVILRRLLYVMIPVALGSLVTNLTSLLDLVTMMRCLGRVQTFHSHALREQLGAIADSPDFPAFVYGSFTGMAITVFNLVPSVTNMLGKSALPCVAALWAKQDKAAAAAHTRTVVLTTALIALPAAGGLFVLSDLVMEVLYSGRPQEAAIAAAALRSLLPGMVCLCLSFPLCSILQGIGKASLPVQYMLAGVAVKLAGNLLLIPQPAFCITGAGISTSACYLLLLVLILIGLRRVLEQQLHLLRCLLPACTAAAACTLTAQLIRHFANGCSPICTLILCTAGGGLVYLLFLWLLMPAQTAGRRNQCAEKLETH